MHVPFRPERVLPLIYLFVLVLFCVVHLWPSLNRSWYFSSDEYVFAAEVVRFLEGDFHQHFFDMPGTPFMLLAASAWVSLYVCGALSGMVAQPLGLTEFTFQNLAWLFTLMRGMTLVFYVLSVLLMYIVATKLTNRMGGCVAAALLATLHVYANYSSFIRVESLAVCLFLAAFLFALRGLESPADSTSPQRGLEGWRRRAVFCWCVAGALAGLAAATRLHSMMGVLPLLMLLAWFGRRGPSPDDLPKWTIRFWIVATVLAFAGAVFVRIGVSWEASPLAPLFRDNPNAAAFLGKASLLPALALLILWALYALPSSRGIFRRLAGPRTVWLVAGFASGLLLGTPTVLWQYRFFIGSINSYTSPYYQDLDRLSLTLWDNLAFLAQFYLSAVAPDWPTLFLLVLGVATALICRDRFGILLLLSAVSFLVSRPIHLRALEHHVILWLPQVVIIGGLGVARLCELASTRYRLVGATFVVSILVYLPMQRSPGLVKVHSDMQMNQGRMANIAQATKWVKQNAEPGVTVAVSYFCFNPDIVYTWFEFLEVPLPPGIDDGREYIVWWGHDRAVQGKSGYAFATPRDIPAMKDQVDAIEPGQGTDPFTDERFHAVASFGSGDNRVVIFKFDLNAVTETSTL